MPKHDFYADPTVFDQWQEEAGNWFGGCAEKLRPFAWSLAFALLGLIFLSTAAGVLLTLLYQALAGTGAQPWGQLLARIVTLAIALVATQSLLRQALEAWPGQRVLPRCLQRLVGWLGLALPKVAKPSVAMPPRRKQRPQRPAAADRRAVQEFLTGVRAAGVNVAIARALFAAGIRSAAHLRHASDAQLQRIHGVGPATVRKLRTYFG